MIEVDSVLFMGLLELVLILLAVDVVIVVRSVVRRRREKASVDRLVTIVRQDAERRKKETCNLLEKKYGYSGEQLEHATKKIVREEKRIYQTLANIFTTRDNIAIENLSILFEEAVEPYRVLDTPKLVAGDNNEPGSEDGSEEVKRLKVLAQTLNKELEVTMNTIGRMLHEYSIISPESDTKKADQNDVIALITPDQASEDVSQIVTKNDESSAVGPTVMASQEMEETAVVDEPEEEAVEDENLDNAVLFGMFQEDEDEDEDEDAAVEDDAEKSESIEDSLAQEIGEVLENDGADLPDINPTEMDIESAEVVADPTEELIAQAIGEAEESHETPLPEIEEEVIEDEAVTSDSIDDLLEQAINQTIESHETELPDMPKEEVVDEPDAEKQLTDEIAETLNNHMETMSSDDIDSLLQGAIGAISEK